MISSIKNAIRGNRSLMQMIFDLRFYIRGNKKSISGKGNKIEYYGAILENVKFIIEGNNNTIFFDFESTIKDCTVKILGDNHLLQIGKRSVFTQSRFSFEDHHCKIIVGDDSSMQRYGEISSVEPYGIVEIGKDCMFSTNVDIRNTDSHSIIDLKTGKRINYGKNIKIGDRVWIGAYAQILKGVTLGDESIIGIRSLVTSDVPANSIASGIPATVIISNITWNKERIV